MAMNTSANENQRRPDETVQPKKPWRKPILAELDLEATETGYGKTSDSATFSSS